MNRKWACLLISGGLHAGVILFGGGILIRPAEYGIEQGESGIPGEIQVQFEEEQSPPEVGRVEAATDENVSPVMELEKKVTPESQKRKAKQESGSEGAQAEVRPNYLKNRPPPYPEESKQRGETGVVLLLVDVNAMGGVSRVRVAKSSGFSRLDGAAVEGVRDWTFFPAKFNGLAISSQAKVPVRFKLE